MVEQWSPNISYRNYFDVCSPKQCQYQQTESANIFDVITILISIYGGLSIVLHLILPHIIRLFFNRAHLFNGTPVIQINLTTGNYYIISISSIEVLSFICLIF